MSVAARQAPRLITGHFEFEALEPLSCGCVAAIHRTLDPGLSIVSLEAKGPYCGKETHRAGRVAAVPSAASAAMGLLDLEDPQA